VRSRTRFCSDRWTSVDYKRRRKKQESSVHDRVRPRAFTKARAPKQLASVKIAVPSRLILAPTATPFASMQSEDAIDGVQFGRLDQLGVRDGDCKQRPIERLFPKRQEIL
jgi:hypothetical protein